MMKRMACIVILFCAASLSSHAQTFGKLYDFCTQSLCADGFRPLAALVQGTDGSFYGTTYDGGAKVNYGSVFKIGAGGHLTTIYSFCSQSNCTDGSEPYAGLVQGTDGNFYGTTVAGGTGNSSNCTAGCGTVFKITPEGTLTTLHSFCSQPNCVDGSTSLATLVQAPDGNFYGTTAAGGASINCTGGCGTVFRITTAGHLTILHSFCAQSNCTDGSFPNAGLVQATDGSFYGTTYFGSSNSGYGTVFRITSAGALTTLYTFCSLPNCTDGSSPYAGLTQGSDGNLYGTTAGGGVTNTFCSSGCGTVFKITTAGSLTTVHNFCLQSNCSDGAEPLAGLVQGTDGNYYGTTAYGGNTGDGGIAFKVTTGGTLTTLYSFCSLEFCWDGTQPEAGLTQATNGTFYGTTEAGGKSENCFELGVGCGILFSLSEGLRPFVETRPTSGKLGTDVFILGNNLTGATSVTFNDTAATFTVASNTLIRTKVPAGATSGFVRVTTPKQALKSNRPFDVIP